MWLRGGPQIRRSRVSGNPVAERPLLSSVMMSQVWWHCIYTLEGSSLISTSLNCPFPGQSRASSMNTGITLAYLPVVGYASASLPLAKDLFSLPQHLVHCLAQGKHAINVH